VLRARKRFACSFGRRLAVSTIAVLAVVSCSADDEAADAPTTLASAQTNGAGDAVTITDMSGELTVPVTTEGIFALDEHAALSLLSLGVRPIATMPFFEDAGAASILRDAGIEITEPTLSNEAILARDPSMIVGIGHPSHDERRAELGDTPFVLPDFTAPWEEQLEVFAALTGTEDDADDLVARVASRTEEVADKVAASDLAGGSVSMLYAFPDGTYFALGNTTLGGRIVEQLGFTRPAEQDAEGDFGFVSLSPEQIPSQGADVVIALGGVNSGGLTVFDGDLLDPGDAVAVTVDGGPWSVNTALSAWWILDDIEAILDGDDMLAADAAAGVWAELNAAGGAAGAGSSAAAGPLDLPSPWVNADGTEVEVPADPQRIVSADIVATELLIELGYGDRVVGIAESNAGFEDDNPALADYERIGNESSPNIEQVAALEPDLIITFDGVDGAAQLAAIAPSVTVPFDFESPGAGYAWRDYFQEMGDRFGLGPQTASFVDALDERIAELNDEIDDGATLAVLRIGQDASFGVYPGFYPADVVRDLGLDPEGTPSAFIPDASSEQCCPDFSAEQLGAFADVDVIFLADDPVNPDDAIERAQSNPLFATLPAVQAGNVFEVSSFAWISWTPQGVITALDDIERHVVPGFAR
jgi:iron complex transport system substrate-binding protein